MAALIDTLAVLARIALRNLTASRLKTIIVGGIIFFGAFLVVIGTSFLDSIVRSMSRSIIGSVAGHIQVYSKASKDELTVMGGFDLEGPDIAPLDDFTRVRDILQRVPNVKDVVPMGISGAIVNSGNTIDVELERLRALVRKRVAGDRAGTQRAYEAQKNHIQQIVSVLRQDIDNVRLVQDERALPPEDAAAIKQAGAPEFWARFDADPLGSLEFLENRIAPLATDADMLFLRYVGTDPKAFAQTFDRMRIVDGTSIPPGRRGFLFSKFIYEEQVKLKTAHRLDKIQKTMANRKVTIARDPELQRFVRENSAQVKELLLQLDAIKTDDFRAKLQRKLGVQETDLGKLLAQFFRMDDSNFADRYAFFYKELAPSLDLYRVRIGDVLTIKAFTRSGYVQSINLRVYGTFEFQGLEGSPQAGGLNLMDMVSFRDLYGFLSPERQRELEELRKSAGVKDISRESAEAELFGALPTPAAQADAVPAPGGKVVEASATGNVEATGAALAGLAAKVTREDLVNRVYDPKLLEGGTVLNAAVILKDDTRIDETIRAIETASAQAGLPLRAISWQAASGIIGQFVVTMRSILFTAVLIIFVVALVIINNAMVMATLERVREIGTLRAVGAQRRFILGMLVIEALVVGAVFGSLGAVVGAGVVLIVGKIGIPASNDIATFFFSGPRLHPALGTSNLAGALFIVLLVSVLSSFYPAWLAMRVTPRQAMQTED